MATTSMKRDFYKVLGIPPISSNEEIKNAYRTLSKKYHPDLNPDLRLYSDDKMKELVEAYTVLSNFEKRKEYDSQSQFQVRKVRRGSKKKADDAASAKDKEKDKYKSEPSLLEKLLSPFLKKPSENAYKPGAHLNPKQADVHFTLGLSMADNAGFIDQAKNEFRMSLKFEPDNPDSYYNYALMCYKLGEFDEALMNFNKVLTLDKENAQARKMLNLLREDI